MQLARIRERCKHPSTALVGVIKHLRLADGRTCNSLRSQCLNCGAWLSLGKSNDSPDSVRVEIAAARLAATDRLEWSHLVDRGDVGFLARVIATHPEGE